MPLIGSQVYRRNLKDFDYDSSLTDDQRNRQERERAIQLRLLKEGGQIGAEGIREVGKNIDFLGKIPDQFRRGRSDNIKLGQQTREDQWRRDMDAEEQGSALTSTDGVMPTPANATAAANEQMGPPQVDTVTTPGAKIRGEVLTSPGAAGVLDGRYKAGFNPSVFGPDTEESVTRRMVASDVGPSLAPTGQAARPMPSHAVSEETAQPQRQIAGRFSNEELMWRAGRDQAVANALNAKRGLGRNSPWVDTKQVDENGNLIKFNQATGEYAVDTGIRRPVNQPDAGLDQRKKEHEDMMAFRREQLGRGGASNQPDAGLDQRKKEHEDMMAFRREQLGHGGASNQSSGRAEALKYRKERDQITDAKAATTRSNALALKKDEALDKKTTSYMDKIGNIPDAILNLESLVSKIPATGDIPGYGQTGMAPNVALSMDGKELRQDMARIFNVVLKDRSGAAVTVPEFERLKTEFGTGSLATDEEFRYALTAAVNAMKEKVRNINAGYDADVIGRYKERGGRDFSTFNPKFRADGKKAVGKKPTEDMTDEELEAEMRGK